MANETIWMAVGFIGQTFFFARFFVQWIASESAKKSVIPMMFWYFSILGGFTLLCYAIYRKDPVFIVGQSTGLAIYLRNIHLSRKPKTLPLQAPSTSLQHD